MLNLNRNVWLLAIMQPLVVSTGGLNSVIASIIGGELSGNPKLATLPIVAFMTGLALFVVPTSKLQQRYGRKPIFIIASLLSAVVGISASISIEYGSFVGFVVSSFAFGTQTATIVQYRYAAIESCEDPKTTASALSLILMGGISSAIIGPELIGFSRYLSIFKSPFANAYLIISLFHIVAAALLWAFLKEVPTNTKLAETSSTTLSAIELKSLFKLAVLTGATAYFVMAMLMTATPLAMKSSMYSIEHIKIVIQAHILAMYIPSLFTAKLVKVAGIHKMLVFGTLTMILSLFVSLISQSFEHYLGSLILLGLGWNILFLSGTTLLSQTYSQLSRFTAQGRFDLTISIAQTSSAFVSGVAFALIGWNNLLLVCFVPLFFLLAYSFKFIDKLPRLSCCNVRLISIFDR